MMKVTKNTVRHAGIAMGLASKVTPENTPEITDPEKVVEVLQKQAEMYFDAVVTAYIAQRIILEELGIPEDEFVKMSEKYVLELAEDASKLDMQKEIMEIMAEVTQTLLN